MSSEPDDAQTQVIDGSSGEGGGQILRTALAFSAISGKPVIIDNIRANRSNPGLARQHLAGLGLISEICGARVRGAETGSTRVEFEPGQIRHGNYDVDVGTAGSITLVLQAALPALASVKGESEITITGGTDVNWSPPLDYYNQVLFPLLARMGLECRLDTEERGYYPKGGGRVKASISSNGHLKALELGPFGDIKGIQAIINITGLPEKIGERMGSSMLDHFPEAIIMFDTREKGPSQGVGLAIAAIDGQSILGASSLGEKGKPAEKVANEAIDSLLAEVLAKASVDIYASDQLLPYIALAGGKYSARKLTGHAKTNVEIINCFVERKIRIDDNQTITFSRT